MAILLTLDAADGEAAGVARVMINGARQTWWVRKAAQEDLRFGSVPHADHLLTKGWGARAIAGSPPLFFVSGESG